MASLRLVPASGSPIEIGKDEVLVGREPSCDVVVSDGSVSRRHAKIEKRGSAWYVADQGSANGTFVDTQRVAEAELKDGQTLRLGAVDFRVEIEVDLAATIAMPQEAVPAPQPPPPAPAPPPRPAPPPAPAAPPRPAAPPPAPAPLPPPAPPAAAPPTPRPRPPAAAPPPPGAPRPSAPPAPAGPARVAAPRAVSPVRSMGPGGQPPAKKGKGPVFWGLVGCCGCLLLAGLGAGGFFGYVFIATQAPVTTVQQMLKELKEGQGQAAYQRLSAGYRARLGPDDFAQLVAVHPGLRANADASFTNRSISSGRATLKDAVLTAASGEVERVTFELIEEGGAWKIDAISFGEGGQGGEGRAPAPPPPPPASGLKLETGGVSKNREGDSIKVEIQLLVNGYEVRARPEGDFALDLVEDVETLGPDGRRIDGLSKDGIERRQSATSESSPPPPQTFSTTLTVDPSNPPGLYTVRLTVHDMIGGRKQTQLANFTLP